MIRDEAYDLEYGMYEVQRGIFLASLVVCPGLMAHPTEVYLSHGVAAFSGDLSDDQAAATTILHARKVPTDQVQLLPSLARSRVGLGFDIISLTTRHSAQQATHAGFPFEPRQELAILGFMMIPSICLLPDQPVAICAGLGLGTVNVNGADNRQDYGTWNYQIDLHHAFHKRFFVKAIWKFVGRVEQRIAGRDSEFSFQVYSIGAGVRY